MPLSCPGHPTTGERAIDTDAGPFVVPVRAAQLGEIA